MGCQGPHAIKARLYNSGKRGEEIRDVRKLAQEVRQGARIFAESCGEAGWGADTSVTHAEV